MPYPPRVHFDGAVYHVAVRGNNRETIFWDDSDRHRYCALLRRYKKRFHFLLHAFALMSNHVHLLIEPAPAATISRIMQCLGTSYTRYFNRHHQRVGHAFQGRFRSRLIESEAYLLVASRYIHLNPVHADMVERPAEYLWSSYRAYLAGADPLGLADVASILGTLSKNVEKAQREYRDFVESPLTSETPPAPPSELVSDTELQVVSDTVLDTVLGVLPNPSEVR